MSSRMQAEVSEQSTRSAERVPGQRSRCVPGICSQGQNMENTTQNPRAPPLLSEAVGRRGAPGQPVWFWASPRRKSPKSLRATCSQSSSPQQWKFFMSKLNSLYFRSCPLPLVLLLGTTEEYWTPSFGVILHQEFILMDKTPLCNGLAALPN